MGGGRERRRGLEAASASHPIHFTGIQCLKRGCFAGEFGRLCGRRPHRLRPGHLQGRAGDQLQDTPWAKAQF